MKTRNLILLAVATALLILIAAGYQLFSGTLFGSPGALHDNEPAPGGTRIIVDGPPLTS